MQSNGDLVETCQYKKKFTVAELANENVLDKIHDIDPSRDLMAFVKALPTIIHHLIQ